MSDTHHPRPRIGRPFHQQPGHDHSYSQGAVEKAIQASNRAGRKIGKREARLIHALLRGRQ